LKPKPTKKKFFSYNTYDEVTGGAYISSRLFFNYCGSLGEYERCSRLNGVARLILVFALDRMNTIYGRTGAKEILPWFTERTFGWWFVRYKMVMRFTNNCLFLVWRYLKKHRLFELFLSMLNKNIAVYIRIFQLYTLNNNIHIYSYCSRLQVRNRAIPKFNINENYLRTVLSKCELTYVAIYFMSLSIDQKILDSFEFH